MLFIGGGVFNIFLVECICVKCEKNCFLVVEVFLFLIIEYKEVILMAFMGVLCLESLFNILFIVIGSIVLSCGGGLYILFKMYNC